MGIADARAGDGCSISGDKIATDRPDVTNSSLTVPSGSLQDENGINFTARSHSAAIDGTNTRLRLGIASCVEVLFDLPNGVHAIDRSSPSGFSNLAPAIKTQLGPLPGAIDLSATIGLGLPTGAVAIAGRGYEPYLQFPWSREIGDGWEIEGMVTSFWLPSQPNDAVLLEPTFAIERDVGRRADLFFEYVGDFPSHSGPLHMLNTGGSYRLTRTQQVDFHTGFGLNTRAPTYFIGVGYSVRWDGLW